jgi:DNA polymerase-3 subunit gamma/tau
VTDWVTVSIPGSSAAAPAPAAVATLERDEPPFDDTPPPEIEPPYEPPLPSEQSDGWADVAPEPVPADASPSTARAGSAAPAARSAPASGARTPTFQQPQRYGEAVVREILGATFIEEQAAPPAGSR